MVLVVGVARRWFSLPGVCRFVSGDCGFGVGMGTVLDNTNIVCSTIGVSNSLEQLE